MLFPGTAGVSPALLVFRASRSVQARRLRSQERAFAKIRTRPVSLLPISKKGRVLLVHVPFKTFRGETALPAVSVTQVLRFLVLRHY
jgi:hypothetical protein